MRYEPIPLSFKLEMDYNYSYDGKFGSNKSTVLYHEHYGDAEIAIINICGSHPAAYIKHPFFEKSEFVNEGDIP